ncbi:MAG: pitrilysin family protein [Candidatus Krumholzibacteriia bacterium]
MRTLHDVAGVRVTPLVCGSLLLAAILCSATPGRAGQAAIPDRPEELVFPALTYDPPRAADYRHTLDGGMVAYLVPDQASPLVTVSVLLRLGPDLDPVGKEGLGSLMMDLLTRSGTADLGAAELEDRVAALGAQLGSGMGGGRRGMMGMGGVRTGPAESWVSLNLLAKDLDAGLALLVSCLRAPAFEADRLQLAREQALQRMKERNDETAGIERREWGYLLDGEGHWSTRWPVQASLASITREDLMAQHSRYVGPENFVLAVSGDFAPKAMQKALERAFKGWPYRAARPGPPPAPDHEPPAGWFVVDKDVNQARVSFGLVALDRYDPDWYAALVMNDILGGGGFSSRLVNRIRSDEGLAYSVRSSLGSGTYYPDDWRVTFQTKVRSTAHAVDIALAEVARIRDEPVSPDELALAKASFVESLPTGFETAGAIAGALAVEELTGRHARDPEYFREYRRRIEAVSAADVQRVARRLLVPDRLTFLVVGNVDEVMLGDPKYDVRVSGLAGGEPTRLPLRDPLTLEPLAD